MKGQIATEYIILVGILLVALIPVFYYTFSESSRTTRINQANYAVNSLASKAESVYALGTGSRDYVWISIPSGVKSYSLNNGTIVLSFYNLGDVLATTKANISGTIPVVAGTYRLSIEMMNNNVVIGSANDTTAPAILGLSPSGIIKINNPQLSVTTDEPSTCKYDTSDKAYSSMVNSLDGSGVSHTKQLNSLANGIYSYYVRCLDRFNNVMLSSSLISFTVNSDNLLPVVTNAQVNVTNITENSYVCVNSTVVDNGNISSVYAMFDTPFNSPLPGFVNYTLSDNGSSCSGGIGDNVYGAAIQLPVAGTWYLNTVFAIDNAGNLGYQNPYVNISVIVSSQFQNGPGNSYTYLVATSAWNIKTPNGVGVTARDNQSTLVDETLALSDNTVTTPPSSARFYYTSGQNSYEGYVLQINQNKNSYRAYTLRLLMVDSQEIPYNLKIYAYNSDSQNIITSNTTAFAMTNIQVPGSNRGYNEVNITNTVFTGKSQYIKIRVVPQTNMNGEVAHISEADIGVLV